MKAKLLVTAIVLPAAFAFTSCKEKEVKTEPAAPEKAPVAENTPDKPEVTPAPEEVPTPVAPDDVVPNVEEPTEAPPTEETPTEQ